MNVDGKRILVVEADTARADAVRRALEGPGTGAVADTASSPFQPPLNPFPRK